jgi:hypothetical protein
MIKDGRAGRRRDHVGIMDRLISRDVARISVRVAMNADALGPICYYIPNSKSFCLRSEGSRYTLKAPA